MLAKFTDASKIFCSIVLNKTFIFVLELRQVIITTYPLDKTERHQRLKAVQNCVLIAFLSFAFFKTTVLKCSCSLF